MRISGYATLWGINMYMYFLTIHTVTSPWQIIVIVRKCPFVVTVYTRVNKDEVNKKGTNKRPQEARAEGTGAEEHIKTSAST